jgi:class 3 adenylate cyclase
MNGLGENTNRGLPEGTVIFLFTDIEGSTKLLDQLGDQYPQLLADQRVLLRAAFENSAAGRSTPKAMLSSLLSQGHRTLLRL